MSAGASTRPTVSDMEDGVSPTGGSVHHLWAKTPVQWQQASEEVAKS